MAGWVSPTANGYHGGSPPTIIDITSNNSIIDDFFNQLMGHHQKVSEPLQKCFTANLLRHWNELISVLREEPRGRWSCEQVYEHQFVRTVITAMK